MKFRRHVLDKKLLNKCKYEEIHTLFANIVDFQLQGEQRSFYVAPWSLGWYDINGDVIYLDGSFDKWDMLKNKIMTILALEKL